MPPPPHSSDTSADALSGQACESMAEVVPKQVQHRLRAYAGFYRRDARIYRRQAMEDSTGAMKQVLHDSTGEMKQVLHDSTCRNNIPEELCYEDYESNTLDEADATSFYRCGILRR